MPGRQDTDAFRLGWTKTLLRGFPTVKVAGTTRNQGRWLRQALCCGEALPQQSVSVKRYLTPRQNCPAIGNMDISNALALDARHGDATGAAATKTRDDRMRVRM